MPATATLPTRERVSSKTKNLLTRGNTKLGELIHTFSLPVLSTCPGASLLCKKLCYARGHHFARSSVKQAYAANYEAATGRDFVRRIQSEIRRRAIRVIRIHVSGDFFSARYIRDWIAIARSAPEVKFYWYTRSWRMPELLPVLSTFAKLPNVFGWFSLDSDTGVPQFAKPENVRYAWLCPNDRELDQVPAEADLVFRDRGKRVTKRSNGVLVCPYESGVHVQTGLAADGTPVRGSMGCSQCRICFTGRNAQIINNPGIISSA